MIRVFWKEVFEDFGFDTRRNIDMSEFNKEMEKAMVKGLRY
jgi:hypothetical protein